MPKRGSNTARVLPLLAEHQHTEEACSHLHPVSDQQAATLSLVFRTFRENQDLRAAYEKLLGQTIQALLLCLEERDPYTYGHSMRVMQYALMMARGSRLSESDTRNVELSAMFHDLGKMGTPDCVLLKPGKLNAEEQKAMALHPVKSGEIVSLIDAFASVVPGVRHHHERVDGKGYPDRLKGAEIPLASRIILVADTFDAMTSTRPYRKALPVEAAYAELERCAGTQFDPELVKVFLREHKNFARGEDEIALPKAA